MALPMLEPPLTTNMKYIFLRHMAQVQNCDLHKWKGEVNFEKVDALSYMCAHNQQLQFLKHLRVVMTNLLGSNFTSCYGQLSTCPIQVHLQMALPLRGSHV
jgi:hypothetical protein